MKLAFNGEGHYTDFSDGYELYKNRAKTDKYVDAKTYNKIIRMYGSLLADRLLKYGIVDLPNNMGMIAASIIRRRPQYRGKKFIGYGKMDWEKGHRDGSPKVFGMVFLPRHEKKNMRCYGFVANRQLFKKMKAVYEQDFCPWYPIEFNDEMI